MTHICRKCGVVLNDENWYPSDRKGNFYICKKCQSERTRLWRKANPEKTRLQRVRSHLIEGRISMNENKECAAYLGVHIAERVLRHVFNDVEVMPYGNPGYDIVCNRGKLVDIKSSCLKKNGQWLFAIKRNTIAEYFLCLAFDNRESLNPMYVWLIPGGVVNHLKMASVSPSTVHKWDEYRIDMDRVVACCDIMKSGGI